MLDTFCGLSWQPTFELQDAILEGSEQRFDFLQGIAWRDGADREAGAGRSKITNQCARSIFLWQGRSWIRKGLSNRLPR